MKAILLRSALLLLLALLLLAGLITYLINNEAFVSKQVQRQLTDMLGWQLEMEGGLSVKWGRSSVVEVHGLRLFNKKWSHQPNRNLLFSASRLRLEFQPLQLLSRRLVMDDLTLNDCTVNYAENEAGSSNWQAQPNLDAHESDESRQPTFSWSLQKAHLTSCDISVLRAGQEQALDINLTQTELQLDAQDNLSAQISGTLQQQELSVAGYIRPWSALWQGGRLQHELDLLAGEVRLHSEGSVDNARNGQGAKLNLRFNGPEFGLVTQWLALPDFSSGDFDAKLQIEDQDSSGQLQLSIDADLGSLEIQGQGKLDRWTAPDKGRMELQIQGPDLDALARTFGQGWLVARPFAIQLKVDIADSLAKLEHFSLQTGTDRITASGPIGAWPDLSGSEIDIGLQSADLEPWLDALNGKKLPLGKVDLEMQLSPMPGDGFRMTANGQLGNKSGQERPLSLQASMQPGKGHLTIEQLDLSLAGDSLNLSGNVNLDQDPRMADSQFNTRLQVADLASSGDWWGMTGLPARPLSISAELSRIGEGLEFHIEKGSLAGLEFSVSGGIPDTQKPLAMNAQFDLAMPSLRMAREFLDAPELPDLTFTAKGKINLDGIQHSTLKDVELGLGRSQARLDANLRLSEGMVGSSAKWKIQGADLTELWPKAGELNLGPFTLNGEWERQPEGNIFKGLQFNSASLSLAVFGSVSDWSETGEFRLEGEVTSPDASQYKNWIGPFFDSQPMALRFSLNGSKAHFAAEGVTFTQGKNKVDADLEFAITERPRISGKITSEVLDLVQAEQHWIALQQEQKQQNTAAASDQPKRLFSEQAIALIGDSSVDLSLDIQVDRLLLSSNEVSDLAMQLDLQQQSLQLNPFAFRGVKGGEYSGRLHSQKRGDQTEIRFQGKAEDLKLGQFGVTGLDVATLPPADVEMDLQGVGRNWQGLAQSLTGKVRWYSEAGRISNTGLNLIFSDLLTQIFSTLNPLSKKSEYTELKCAVYAVDFMDGKMKLSPMVIQTDQITAFSEGEVDLATEQINLNFRTVAQKGLGISAGSVVNPFFKMGGTLLNPALQLDVTRGAISGGAMVATAGLSVLFKSLSDRLLASKQPCSDARATIESRDSGLTAGN